MASVTLEKIVKDYGKFRAVHEVDLDIRDGEFVALVGPSGCGKSTLLRMVAGLEEISGGRMLIGDRLVNEVEPRGRDVAMVFQDYALYPHMSIAENIGFGLRMRGVARGEIERLVAEAASILQIEDLLGRKPGQLSGGQRQRVAMGRAIVRRPKVFLFDEPLSNLDAKLRVDMRTQIKRLHQMLATTTIYVTHDQVEAMTLADRVVILKDGRIMQAGAPNEVYARPNSRFVGEFIGSPQMNMLAARVDRAGRSPAIRYGAFNVPLSDVEAADGAEVVLGFRPEHLQVCAPERASFAAVVDVFEPLGSDTLAVCMLEGAEITARLDPELPLEKGGTLHFSVDPARIHLFDAQNGARLAFQA
ncbi:ABC transporter ATP-binding protein [Nitratireductor luteus]|uniref:ABC transporter ATP-binding protein n=1 Tax=Nitratireductor luteus TaxID=2976980 RepID=UPI00223FE760|nr:sn-glycerol-3-phosphate ABC transporter ATP-binding protein UgpC [Nitratireductor luteus]